MPPDEFDPAFESASHAVADKICREMLESVEIHRQQSRRIFNNYLAKSMQKTFEAGKSAKELGIDTTRKFVVVKNMTHHLFEIGETLFYDRGNEDYEYAYFINEGSESHLCSWENLAYYEEPTQEPEVYVPKVGDVVQLEATIKSVREDGCSYMTFKGQNRDTAGIVLEPDELAHIKLISRKPKLKLTMEQLREKVGDDFEIVD